MKVNRLLNSSILAVFMLASSVAVADRLLVGGDLNNGNFNAGESDGNASFANTPGWVNIGTGDQAAVATRVDETYDGTRNAVLAQSPGRVHGLDTGHTIQAGDIYSLSYVWKDSYLWDSDRDQVVVRPFTTSDDTITGTRNLLVSMSSGVSTQEDTYEPVEQRNVYMAQPQDVGRRLFVAVDTYPGEGGFARMDDFRLSVISYGTRIVRSAADEADWDLSWTAIPDRHYTLLHSTDLQQWEPVRKHVPAMEHTTLGESILADETGLGFFKVRQEPDSGMIDPDTPADAQPFLDEPTGDDWVLDFSDEFNGTEVDTRKWWIEDSPRSRAARPDRGINRWFWRPQNVSVSGGHLVLDVTKVDDETMYCGSISSRFGLYETTYGYLEARVKIGDTTKDTHTAFWLQGKNMGVITGNANNGAEVDIFESAWFGNFTKSVVHIDGYGQYKQARTVQYSTPGLHDGFNVFGLHWTPNEMRIFYNGEHKVTYTGKWVPQVPEWLWLSNGASFGDIGTFQDEPRGWLTSAKFDYVRVWKSR